MNPEDFYWTDEDIEQWLNLRLGPNNVFNREFMRDLIGDVIEILFKELDRRRLEGLVESAYSGV